MRTRAEHIVWCKKRAHQELNSDAQWSITKAWDIMFLSMLKHLETKDHPALKFGHPMIRTGELATKRKMKEFIDDFH